MLSPAELARLEELHAKATHGEMCQFCRGSREVYNAVYDDCLPCLACRDDCRKESIAKAALRDAMQQLAPALIAGCREAERLRAGLAAKVAEWRERANVQQRRIAAAELQALLDEVKRDA